MTPPDRSAAGDVAPSGAATFALAWAHAMQAVTYVPMTWAEKADLLHALTIRLAAAVRADTVDVRAGYRVGVDLVDADFTAPQALARTLTLIYTRLLPDLGLGSSHAQRLATLAEAVATGHAHATRDRALDGQEAVRQAAVQARAEAEHELRQAQLRLHHAALHDALTELPNRALFTQRVTIAMTSPPCGRVAVAIIGLDAFAAIHECLGPLVADRLLAAVAARLAAFTQDGGHLLARLDADEFALLITTTTCSEDAVKLADRILRVLDEPFTIDTHDLPVHASIGIIENAAAVEADATDLIRAARAALGWARYDRTTRWALFDPDRHHRQIQRWRLTAAMPAALTRGEFGLHYQPVLTLGQHRLVALEALARWHHPALGMIGPDQFIPLAEGTGLIITLGLRLLEQACHDAAAWLRQAPHAPYVSVNLAAAQIAHPSLVGDVLAILDDAGLPAQQLQLEITETAAIDTDPRIRASLHDLARHGIRLALDDFGAGYANYEQLSTLPIGALKLDAAFTRDLHQPGGHPRHEAILAQMINLGHRLDLTIIAEGIETADAEQCLHIMGCDLGQGWHLGRPAPHHHITQTLLT